VEPYSNPQRGRPRRLVLQRARETGKIKTR
jgi:hypothetical protein